METKIIEAISAPKALEILYRESPIEFLKAFPSVFANHSESAILQVWQERINYDLEIEKRKAVPTWSFKNLLLLVLLIAVAGTIFKLPDYFDSISYSWLYDRNLSLVFIVPLIAYFTQRLKATKHVALIVLISAGALLYLNFLPSRGDNYYEFSKMYGAFEDALTNAEIHIPLFLWLLTGVVFAGVD